jgi:hypothetical protein
MSPTPSALHVVQLDPDESTREFIDIQWRINARDPNWVAPLRMTVRSGLNRKKHPFHQHAKVALFIARRGRAAVGRIAAIVNRAHNEFHGDSVGFFGLFECLDDPDASAALLGEAEEWLRRHGCTSIRGPVNLSTNDEISSPGILIEGFDSRPVLMMSHNPRYYAALVERKGYVKARDLVAYWFDNPESEPSWGDRMDRALARAGVTIRALELSRFREDLDRVKEVYNAAWSRNWGFVPMQDAEFEHLAKEFRPIVDPDLCLIAEVGGEPVGFSLALPDLNVALARIPSGRLLPAGIFKLLWHQRRIRSMRVMTLGFKPQYQHAGLGPAFYVRTWQTGVRKGYRCGEAGWILEDNMEMARPLERIGGRIHRRYRIYEKEL